MGGRAPGTPPSGSANANAGCASHGVYYTCKEHTTTKVTLFIISYSNTTNKHYLRFSVNMNSEEPVV